MINKNITFKLTMSFVAIVLISMLTIGVFFINMFKNYSFESKKQNMFERAREIALVVEKLSQSPSSLNNYPAFVELLDSFASARIWVTDRNGKIVTMSQHKACAMMRMNQLPPEGTNIIKYALEGKETSSKGFSNMYNETMFTVGVPIYGADNKIIGTVLLHSPVTGVTNTIDDAFNYLLLSILIASLLAGGLGILYSRKFTKPLKRMNKSALEMTNGNYSIRSNINQNDEIGQLSNSLDLLASKLGYTIDQLFQEKNKLDDVMASISEGILALDVDMNLINYNEALKSLLGYSWNEDITTKISQDLIAHNLLETFQTVIKTGDNATETTAWANKILKFTVSPIKNSNNEIIGVVSLIADISASERLDQMRKDFVANVSHEFRTPLTIIKGSIEAIVDKAVTDKSDIEKFNYRILNETKALERLVTDLLDLSKMQSENIALQIEDVDLVSLAQEAAASMQTIARRKNTQIEFSSAPEVPPIAGDHDRLRQLLIIFLDNAIKYSPEHSKIQVQVLKDQGYVHLNIKDNGAGIPKEDIPFIWDRFYKADKSRVDSDTGTGLGLAIAKHLILLHKASVRVESQVNKGTTIEICFPYLI